VTDLIHVEPAPETRIALARWAVAQTPKVGTVGPNTFAIPSDLFTSVPEAVLIGARVGGHRYVSPTEEESVSVGEGAAETELTGVARPEGLVAAHGELLPEVPAEAYGPDAVPLPEAEAEAEPDDHGETAGEPSEAGYTCDVCGRTFSSDRGLATHARRAHQQA
jgi:hypothetical protein